MSDESDQRVRQWEEQLARAWAEGRAAEFDRTSGACVRAAFLRDQCLMLSTLPASPATNRHLRGTRVVGQFDLSGVDLADHGILFEECDLEDVSLEGARVRALRLLGCTVRSIRARNLEARDGVWLAVGGANHEGRRFWARGAVDISGANIGRLQCTGGHFCNPDGRAINADGVTITRDVFLNRSYRSADKIFEALGEVTFVGATIARQLNCTGGRFHGTGEEKIALSFDAAVVQGYVYLNEGFHASGRVTLQRARIDRQVYCTNGTFENGHGVAIDAERLECQEDVILRGAIVVGDVSLTSTRVRYDLDCSGAQMCSAENECLDGAHMSVGRQVVWKLKETPKGSVHLTDADIGHLADDVSSWPTGQDRMKLRGLRYRSLETLADDPSEDLQHRRDWLKRSGDSGQPYEQLARWYRESGREDEAIEVGIAREDALVPYYTLDIQGMGQTPSRRRLLRLPPAARPLLDPDADGDRRDCVLLGEGDEP